MDNYLAVGLVEGFEEAESEEQIIEAWQHARRRSEPSAPGRNFSLFMAQGKGGPQSARHHRRQRASAPSVPLLR